MPDLPTKTLSQEHYDRVVAAFPGETPAEKAASYDAWHTNHLIDFVEQAELRALQEENNLQLELQMQEVRDSLPDRAQFPTA